jgi:hypothetical protein
MTNDPDLKPPYVAAPADGEACLCGMPARVVYLTESGPVPSCLGRSDDQGGDGVSERSYGAMIERARTDPAYREGLLDAARIYWAHSTRPELPAAGYVIERLADGKLP